MSQNDLGRVADGEQALVNQAAAHLGPSGFDPSRVENLPWKPMSEFPVDGDICAVCYREFDRPDGALRIQLAQWIDLYANGGKLCSPNDYDHTPYAEGWLRLDELHSGFARVCG